MIVKRRTTKIAKDTYLIMPDNNKKSNPNLGIEIIVRLKEFLGLVFESLLLFPITFIFFTKTGDNQITGDVSACKFCTRFIFTKNQTWHGNSSENFTPRGIEESRNGDLAFLGDRGR